MTAGRPTDQRARDRLGRPVPIDAPERADPGVAVDEERAPHDTVITAEQLLARGFPFAAHEVFETRWKVCPPDESDLWQGLAQWCVAVTHAERGNAVGAERLRNRALSHLTLPAAAVAATRIGLDLRHLTDWLVEPGPDLPTLTGGPLDDAR